MNSSGKLILRSSKIPRKGAEPNLKKHAQRLKKLKSEVQDRIGKEGTPEGGSYSEGMHEAIEDIVKAMKDLGSYLA